MQDIDNTLKAFVQERLAPAKIVEVNSIEAEDADGGPILRIRVIYEAENNRLDPEKVVGLSRLLHKVHGNLFTDRYPLFSFMIPEEAEFATT